MGLICAVTFTDRGRLYYADPGTLTPAVGDHVLYPTVEGPEVAQVMWAPQWSAEEIGGLPKLVGMAAPDDIAALAAARKKRAEARVASRRLIREHKLPMKVVGVDHVLADNRTVIYFSAPHRVDFRSLVRDLGATLRGRVELRQLSSRDEARLIGGIGSCGRELCCSTFLVDFEPVSVRMAKDQDLPLNPLRISGACGRLMCCLKFEHPLYQDFSSRAPEVGSCVSTPDGEATVLAHSVPTDSVVLRMNADGRRTSCALASVCSARKAHDQAYGDGTVGSAKASPHGDATPATAETVVSATVTDGVPPEAASPVVSGAVEAGASPASGGVEAASPAPDSDAATAVIVGDTPADGIVLASTTAPDIGAASIATPGAVPEVVVTPGVVPEVVVTTGIAPEVGTAMPAFDAGLPQTPGPLAGP